MAVLPVLAWSLLACNPEAEEELDSTVAFLSPADGETVPAGDVSVALIVEDFELEEPESARRAPEPLPWVLALLESPAYAHNEGAPAGYVELSLDGASVTQLAETQYTLTGVAAGAHTLEAELFFADGDELDPPVSASVTFTAE